MHSLNINPGTLSLGDLRCVYEQPVNLSLDAAALPAIEAAYTTVMSTIAQHKTVYGINTGFGMLANTLISDEGLEELQRNLVLSHAAGVGPLLEDAVVRLIMVLKINSLARGYSGVRVETIQHLAAMVNAGCYPCIPSKGSVGASGDLAPLAHMTAAMMGYGMVHLDGDCIPAAGALTRLGLEPQTFSPKEGLALLNGTQVSTALALAGLFKLENLFSSALVFGAMSVDAAMGADTPFDARLHQVRGQPGQQLCAQVYRSLLSSSEIRASHWGCAHVQDPYSLRCQPQVMGACLDLIYHAARTLHIEANAVSDNPIVFSASDEIISGGNFHAEPVAFAADMLALSIAEVGSLSERRIALLNDAHLSNLPAFLVRQGGLNSGYMLPHVTAAALASENKSLAHPASVDSLPTSANQEDHVSMATFAARRLGDMTDNAAAILAIEYLCATQGIDLRQPLHTSPQLQKAVDLLRTQVPFYEKDRLHAPDILAAKQITGSGIFNTYIHPSLLPSLANGEDYGSLN